MKTQIEDLTDLKLMTIGFLKTSSAGHYSGRDYGLKGHLAYTKDGNSVEFSFITRLTYQDVLLNTLSSGKLWIWPSPSNISSHPIWPIE